MTVAILLAPATRVGYLLYPVDLFVWAWLLRSEDTVDPVPEEPERGAASRSRRARPEPAGPGTDGPVRRPSASGIVGRRRETERGARLGPRSVLVGDTVEPQRERGGARARPGHARARCLGAEERGRHGHAEVPLEAVAGGMLLQDQVAALDLGGRVPD